MIEIGFYLLSALMVFSAYAIIQRSENRKAWRLRYILVAGIWIMYLTIMSNNGVFKIFSLPPRVPLLIVLPMFVTIFIVTSRKSFLAAIDVLPNYWPVYIQSFRIVVELLFYGALLQGVLIEKFTFVGQNYDILVGLSAPAMGFLVQRNVVQRSGILIWNFASLAVLGFTIYTILSTFYFSDFVPNEQNLRFGEMPYVLIPGILAPFAIFYHVVSLRQQTRKK